MAKEDVQRAVRKLLQHGYKVAPSSLQYLFEVQNLDEIIDHFISSEKRSSAVVSHKELLGVTVPKSSTVPATSIQERIETSQLRQEQSSSVIKTSSDHLNGLHNYESQLEVLWQPSFSGRNLQNFSDFVTYFQSRYRKLSTILRANSSVTNLTSIKRLGAVRDKDVTVIGMVTSKQFPSTGGAIVELEDISSETVLSVLVPKSEAHLVEEFLHIMDDSVIAVKGVKRDAENIIANEVILPDIPSHFRPKMADVPVHAAFLSDIHIGSDGFLSKPFERFIKFLRGEYGNSKMRKVGLQTKYVLFAGDVVDGIGIYPNQEEELVIHDIKGQYNEFARYLEQIPDDVEIVVIPGNHDHVRPAEPQPIIQPVHAPDLHTLKNVHLLPNPAQVRMHGVSSLLYHCTSLPDILSHLPNLKTEKPAEVMLKMLQARHLAPVWGARTPIAPEPEDNLVIEKIPDLFHGGHIHINDLAEYRGVKILNSGTMQEQTSYQKALNILPTPGEVIVLNLMTHEPNLIRLL